MSYNELRQEARELKSLLGVRQKEDLIEELIAEYKKITLATHATRCLVSAVGDTV